MDLGLKGRVAIVAAASKGLGRAVAEEFAREGCELAICARTEAAIERAAKEIERSCGRAVFRRAMDVTNAEAVRQFVADVDAKFGRLDICVTNAGGPPAKKFAELSIEDWRHAVDLTLMSAVHLLREAVPRMTRNRWGRLLAIASVSVKQPIEGLLLSNSLRAAVAGLMKTLANELGADGITSNTVCPGYTLTERLDDLAAKQATLAGKSRDEIFQAWSSQIPIGRVARPEEFAALVVFLASERASAINGTTIAVDGGWTKGLL